MKKTIREMIWIAAAAVASPAGTGSKSTGIRKGQQPAVNRIEAEGLQVHLPLQGAVQAGFPLEETISSDSTAIVQPGPSN